MRLNLRNILLNNNSLKLLSLFFGFGLWYVVSQPHTIRLSVTAPVCFYNSTATKTINAPETVTLELAGKRSDIQRFDQKNCALHLDAQQFAHGQHHLIIDEKNLFLPATIKLVNCIPSHVVINVTATKEELNACIT